jgi:PAS domain S-box-containing protein
MAGTALDILHKSNTMQPFQNALKQFFCAMGGRHADVVGDQQVVPEYLARMSAWVLETMARLKSHLISLDSCMPAAFLDASSATVGFAGSYSGSVSIHCSMLLAGKLASRMTGLDSSGEHEGFHDALGEMTMVLAGEIKQALSAGGLDIQLSTPSIVSGSHYLLSEAKHHQRVTVCLQIEGEPLYVALVAERNSLLQAAAAELRSKREWLTLALEGGSLGLWEWNLVTGKTQYSNEWASMLGYQVDDLIPDSATWESLIHPDDLPLVQAALHAHLSGHSSGYEIEHRLLNRAGAWCWILSRGRVMQRQDDGTPLLIAGTHLDISERKTMEQALRESQKQMQVMNEQLERRVTEEVKKNREKDGMLQQQEKLASIGQLAAGVAHEINNPMGFIMSNLNTLKEYAASLKQYCQAVDQNLTDRDSSLLQEVRKQLDLDYILDDLQPLLAESSEGAERVRRIVLDLKDFARTDEQNMHEADLNQLIQSTINIVRNELRYVAELDLQLGELPPVTCHPQQINQVISNLLVNAAHAIEQQGVITIRSWHEAGHVLLSVSDTGKGIAAELLGRIFDPFFTTKDVGKGTGLGLSISYDIVKKHNGQITVASEQGLGTTFTVSLPLLVA